MTNTEIKIECPESKIGRYFCPTCKNETEHNVLTIVKKYDEEYCEYGNIQFWDDYYTTECRGCKTISFCKIYICSEEFDFDYRGTPHHKPHKETYPLVEISEEENESFVSKEYINKIQACSNDNFDTSKLYQLMVELNIAYNSKSYLSCIFLIRSIIDHVPPIFGKVNFNEVTNNYSLSGRSFKDAMVHLQNSSRKIADLYLHSQIRKNEILPSKNQIEFRADLDLLISEIIRILSISNN